jgi:hypothetical protein
VGNMSDEYKEEIAEAIQNGDEPSEVVDRYSKKNKSWNYLPGNGLAQYLRPLREWKRKMKARLPEIETVRARDAEELQKARDVIDRLLAKVPEEKDLALEGDEAGGTEKDDWSDIFGEEVDSGDNVGNEADPEGFPAIDEDWLKERLAYFQAWDREHGRGSMIGTVPTELAE